MILEVDQDIQTEVSDYGMAVKYPINPARRALWSLQDIMPNYSECYTFRKLESAHTVVGIKGIVLEKWE